MSREPIDFKGNIERSAKQYITRRLDQPFEERHGLAAGREDTIEVYATAGRLVVNGPQTTLLVGDNPNYNPPVDIEVTLHLSPPGKAIADELQGAADRLQFYGGTHGGPGKYR